MTRTPLPDVETLIVGGGAVGLAIAAECARAGHDTCLLERHAAIGQEASARSSEVIHAGLYYPTGSLKARLCVDGRDRLYAYARDRGIGVQRTGKLIVATSPAEEAVLDAIAAQAKANGVDDIQTLSSADLRSLEPDLSASKALLSSSTGIIDSHGLMQALAADLQNSGGQIVLHAEVRNVTLGADGMFEVETASGGETARLTTRNLIAAAGLQMAILGPRLPRAATYAPPAVHFAKGHYFALRQKAPFRHLIYPVPVDGGLGVHLTCDLAGRVRFGPDVEWIDRIDYAFDDVDGSRSSRFEHAIRRYWPGLPADSLSPDTTGIRPKLSRRGEPARDFAIHGSRDHGVPRLIALYGIESPGLTSCLAIARYCRELMASG